MSGGLVYEYYQQEDNNYGLVNIYDNETAEIRVDYDNLQKAYGKLDFKSLQSQNSSGTTIKAPTCGRDLIESDSFSSSFELPDPPEGAQDLIDNGVDGAREGKLVPVKDTKVALPVYGSNGEAMQNLAIKPLADDQSNTPTSVAGGARPSESKKGAASGRMNVGWLELALGTLVPTIIVAVA